MAIDQVGELWEKITALDTKAKELRRESNENVAWIPDEDGQPKQIINDAVRFKQIGKELQDVAAQRALTMGKLSRVQDLLGESVDGSLAALSGAGYIDQATRLRFRFANELHPMMTNYRRALLLSEVQELPEFKRLEAETVPEIKRLEAKAAADQQLAAQVYSILRAI